MKRVTAGFELLVVLFMLLLVFEPLPVHASATLIQQNNAGCVCTSSSDTVTVPLNSVTSGDVLVVGIETSTTTPLSSLMDTRGSVFTQTTTATGDEQTVAAIYTSTLASSG